MDATKWARDPDWKPFSLISPFPTTDMALRQCFEWHKRTTTIINGESLSQEEFVHIMREALLSPNVRSWGIVQSTSKRMGLSGLVLFDPIYRGWELVDGNIHIALARSAWGKKAIQLAAQEIIPELFTSIPSLTRLSGMTPSHYTPGLAIAKELGFVVEGVLKDAVRINGTLRDLTLQGLTRKDYI